MESPRETKAREPEELEGPLTALKKQQFVRGRSKSGPCGSEATILRPTKKEPNSCNHTLRRHKRILSSRSRLIWWGASGKSFAARGSAAEMMRFMDFEISELDFGMHGSANPRREGLGGGRRGSSPISYLRLRAKGLESLLGI